MKQIIVELSAELAAPASPEAIKKWRQRGEVPSKHRLPLLNLAKRRKLPLSERDFDFPPTKGTKPQKRRAA